MRVSRRRIPLLIFATVGLAGAPVVAQEPPGEIADPDSVAADSARVARVSPGGAFLRSMIVPGWGQASVGAYNRAGFYFAVDAISGWMFLKSARTLDSAEEELTRLEARVRSELVAEGITDLEEIENALAENETVDDQRSLVESRSQQREDWLAFGVFMLFVGGADAFVAGHLADFPEAIEAGFRVLPRGGLEAGLSLRLPNH